MTLGQLIAVLKARWMAVAGLIALGVILAIVITIKQPPSYSASSELIITPNTPEVMQSDGSAADGLYLKTQIDILSSDRVLLRAVQRLDLEKNPAIVKAFQEANIRGTIDQFCISMLRKALTVLPSKDSRLVRVIAEGRDPEFAAEVANAIANAFVDVNADLTVTTARRSAEDFNKQATALRQQLNQAQQRLAKYRQDNGLIAIGDHTEGDPIANLSAQLAAAQLEAIEAEGHRVAAAGALKSRQGTAATNIITSPLLENLEAEEGRAISELQSLAGKVGQQHPDYVEHSNRIRALRGQIEVERRRVSDGLAVNAKMAATRVEALKAQIAAETQKVLAERSNQDELNALLQEVENAQRAYELILQRFSRAELNSESEEPSVAILTAAVPPLKQSGLSFTKNIVLGGLFGLLAGIVAAAVHELSDLRIRTADDIERWLGVPNLAEIPMATAAVAGHRHGATSLPGQKTYRLTDQTHSLPRRSS